MRPFLSWQTRLVVVLAAEAAALLMLVSTLWQLVAAVWMVQLVVRIIGQGVVAHVGVAAMALAWMAAVVAAGASW